MTVNLHSKLLHCLSDYAFFFTENNNIAAPMFRLNDILGVLLLTTKLSNR